MQRRLWPENFKISFGTYLCNQSKSSLGKTNQRPTNASFDSTPSIHDCNLNFATRLHSKCQNNQKKYENNSEKTKIAYPATFEACSSPEYNLSSFLLSSGSRIFANLKRIPFARYFSPPNRG